MAGRSPSHAMRFTASRERAGSPYSRLSAILGQVAARATKANALHAEGVWFCEAPGSDLLSHGLSHTTIGAGAFHFRVRDGNGWDHAAVSAREAVEVAATLEVRCSALA